VETQADLTPFQRMVLLDELEAQQKEAQSKQSGGGGRVNSLRQPGGGGKSETTTYVNDGDSD
jgi:hypothetical protein